MHAFQQHAETGAPVTGVPLAMGLAAEIVKSCDELVKQHVCPPRYFFGLGRACLNSKLPLC